MKNGANESPDGKMAVPSGWAQKPAGKPHVAYVLTSAMAANILLRGQFAYLRRCGFDVTIVAAPGPHLDEVGRREGVRIVPAPLVREAAPLRDLTALIALCRILRQLRPTLVNVGTPKAGLLGGLAAWITRVPCRVYTLHGLRLETESGKRRRLLWFCERLACAAVQRVVCVSPSVEQAAHSLGIASTQKTLIVADGSANGVDAARFASTPQRLAAAARLRGRLGIPATARVIGFAGRLTNDKGIAELLDAFALVSQSAEARHLLLIGDFEPGDPPPTGTRERIETNPDIHWTGFVRDPAAYYHVMDVLALPTRREGFPTVVLEAHASGKPVVAFDATGSRDAVLDGVNGYLVCPPSVGALAARLRMVLDDPALARRLGDNGRRRVEADYRPETVWAGITGLYRMMMLGLPAECAVRLASIDMTGYSPPPRAYRWTKRAFDVCAAGLLLATASPLLALAALAVRLTMGSPALFRQTRPGLGEQPFEVLKLRTMTDARGPDGALLPDAGRMTRLGRFLRRTSIDELPQLWSVLRGQMSLVGPRPLLTQYLPRYTPLQRRRHLVKPGITGWAQIHGRNHSDWDKRLAEDVWYSQNASLRLDMHILRRTAWLALRQHGISRPGHATMPEFEGSAAGR